MGIISISRHCCVALWLFICMRFAYLALAFSRLFYANLFKRSPRTKNVQVEQLNCVFVMVRRCTVLLYIPTFAHCCCSGCWKAWREWSEASKRINENKSGIILSHKCHCHCLVWPVLDRYNKHKHTSAHKHQPLKWWSEKKDTLKRCVCVCNFTHSNCCCRSSSSSLFSFTVQRLLFYLLASTMTIIIMIRKWKYKSTHRAPSIGQWVQSLCELKWNIIRFSMGTFWIVTITMCHRKRRLASFDMEILFLKMIISTRSVAHSHTYRNTTKNLVYDS